MNDQTEPLGATSGDDTSGLLQTNLTTRAVRDAAELEAISRAYDQYIHRARRKRQGSEWLTDDFIRKVHHDMFGSIWDWAGRYRTTQPNIGIQWQLVPEQVTVLCGDFRYWDSNDCSMSVLEVAARLQHRLTYVHPFQNGNGRLARLITDIFFYSRHHVFPQWPQIHRMPQGDRIRDRYIHAMRSADDGNYLDLISFMEECLPQRPPDQT
jgi:Fic-DOC domain mobile mystery protein B